MPFPPPADVSLPSPTKPTAPQPPAEPEITEPVATVHRFTGTYLGGNDRRHIVYAETGDGRAEVQSRPSARSIPKADADDKDDVTRIAIPTGKVARHDRFAFVTAARELIAIDSNGDIEWRFTLPGKPDNGERLLDVAGFHDGQVFVVSQQVIHDKGNTLGQLYALKTDTGSLVSLTTIKARFDPDARLILDRPNGALFAFSRARIVAHALPPSQADHTCEVPTLPIAHASVTNATVCTMTPTGLIIIHFQPIHSNVLHARPSTQIGGVAGTAPAAIRSNYSQSGARIYAPVKSAVSHFVLAAFDEHHATPAWQVRVPKAITAAPVLYGSCVYFVAGNVLYRVNADTGAVCWKHTIPLAPSETLTDLAFTRGEIRASGPGVLVRVTDRPEPAAAFPSAAANPASRMGVPHPPDPSP
ncbi:PQQ-binding-like beta-propeller repeat protein [Frigoriglobus tundricola]|uniref:PQQ-binding-like beta-propeller repeat protein n=1 Tax=Frigoriglobus tundricola TaxID=2774151 RepID=UPI00148E985A|nr:PQQ-binding-like beta-propeller repeat protein [Frigoriglobus tundricola]